MMEKPAKFKNNLIVILILLIFLSVRLAGLGPDISNTDAYRWHLRSLNFLEALKSGNLKETYQHYQPGLTIMWLNAPLEQFVFSYQYHILENEHPLTLENADWYPVIHGISKAELVFALAVLLLIQIKLLENIFSKQVAYFFGFLMAVEPYLIGIDRWFHLTSLEAYFGFTAVLYLLLWDQRSQKKNLIIAGIIYALAILSKVSSLLISPLFLMIILKHSLEEKEQRFKNFFLFLLNFIFPLVITVLVLFPALSVEPIKTIVKMWQETTAVSLGSLTYPFLSKWLRVIFYDLILLFKLSPLTLILFLFGLFNFSKIRKSFSLAAILTGFIFYYMFLSFFPKKIDRYVIAMFPYIILISAYFLTQLQKSWQIVFLAFSGLYLIFVSYIFYPVYSAYYSPLFGGTLRAIQLGIYDNSGEYFSQAAYFLNGEGRDKKVFVPDGVVSFSYYYKGKIVNSLADNPDYLVVSYDSDRKTINDYYCRKKVTGFGNKVFDVVDVFSCP